MSGDHEDKTATAAAASVAAKTTPPCHSLLVRPVKRRRRSSELAMLTAPDRSDQVLMNRKRRLALLSQTTADIAACSPYSSLEHDDEPIQIMMGVATPASTPPHRRPRR